MNSHRTRLLPLPCAVAVDPVIGEVKVGFALP